MKKHYNSRRKMKSNAIHILCAVCLILVVLSGCVLASSKTTAKAVYSSMLNKMAKDARLVVDKIPSIDDRAGKIVFNDTMTSTYSGKKIKDTEHYEVMFNGNKLFVKDDEFKAIYDRSNGDIFVKKLEKGKEVGDVLLVKKPSWKDITEDFDEWYRNDMIYENLEYSLTHYIDDIDLLDILDLEDFEDQRNGYELYAIVLETLANNLKDSYFIDEKASNLNCYTLSLNNEQLIEYMENVIRDLAKNSRFLELMDVELTDEEINDDLAEMKEKINQIKDLKVTLSIYTTSNLLKDLVGLKVSLEGFIEDEKLEFVLDFNSNGTKPLKAFEDMTGSIKLSIADYIIDSNIQISKNQIKLLGNASYKMPSFGIDDNFGFKVDYKDMKESFEFIINTEDEKEFLKSSSIVANLKVDSNGNKNTVRFTLKGNSDKSMMDSSEIVLNMTEDEVDSNNLLKLYTEDKKSFKESSKLVCEFEDGKIILEMKDNKSFMESSNILLSAEKQNEKFDLISVKSNDKKSILKSTDLEISISREIADSDTTVKIKAKDKKPFSKSTNIEIIYQGELDYSDADVLATIKGNKDLLNASKLEITVKGTVDNVQIDGSLKIESLDKKSIRESSNFKGNLQGSATELYGDASINVKASFNTSKAIEFEQITKYEQNEQKYSVKVEFLDNIDFDKLFNTKSAVESSAKGAILIVNPNYKDPFAWKDLVSSYQSDDDLEGYDESDWTYTKDEENSVKENKFNITLVPPTTLDMEKAS